MCIIFKVYFYFSIYVLELILFSPVFLCVFFLELIRWKKVSLHRDKLKVGNW